MTATHTTEITKSFELDAHRDIRNVHGAPGWFELTTADPEAAKAYLGRTFGWTFDTIELCGSPYTVIRVQGYEIGGIRPPMPGAPEAPVWSTYVTVEDVDELARSAEAAGGKVVVPPTDLGDAGRLVQVEHPQAGIIQGFEYPHAFT